MAKRALIFLVFISVFLQSGCEFFDWVFPDGFLFIRNESSEEIVNIFEFTSELSSETWELSEGLGDQTIPIGTVLMLEFNPRINYKWRFESISMYWECSHGGNLGGVTMDRNLTDDSASQL